MEYPKIETLFKRDPVTFKVLVGEYKNEVISSIRVWHWTEKVDGTNIRIIWNAKDQSVTVKGRTDKATLPSGLVEHILATIKPGVFIDEFSTCDVVVYGEGYGAGIQKVGSLYRPDKAFVAFDLRYGDHGWATDEALRGICAKLNLPVVPDYGALSLDCAIGIVKHPFQSRLTNNPCPAEGLVGRTLAPLFDGRGNRLIVKLKTCDFAQ